MRTWKQKLISISLISASLVQLFGFSAYAAADTQSPTVPTNLVCTSKTSTNVTLSWTAATDNVNVIAYDIYNETTKVGSTTGATTFTVTGLTAGTLYNFAVKARDAAGNISAASTEINTATIGTDGQMLYNPSFDANDSNWYVYTDDTAQVNEGRDTNVYDSAPASYKVECVKKGDTKCSIQMYHSILMNIVENKTYRLTFRAKSTSNVSIQVGMLSKGVAPTNTGIDVTSSWQGYTIDFKANATASDARIYFCLGNALPAGASVNIDSLKLNETEINTATIGTDGQMLYNPSFDADDSNWYVYTDNTAQVNEGRDTKVYDSAPASYKVECVKNGDTTCSIQMSHSTLMNIVENKTYRLTFRAKSTSNVSILVGMLSKGVAPWTNAGIDVTSSWQGYTIDFKANATASDARIYFCLGKLPVGTSVNIDSLKLNELK